MADLLVWKNNHGECSKLPDHITENLFTLCSVEGCFAFVIDTMDSAERIIESVLKIEEVKLSSKITFKFINAKRTLLPIETVLNWLFQKSPKKKARFLQIYVKGNFHKQMYEQLKKVRLYLVSNHLNPFRML